MNLLRLLEISKQSVIDGAIADEEPMNEDAIGGMDALIVAAMHFQEKFNQNAEELARSIEGRLTGG